MPSVNFTPWISFGNWLWPSIRRQFFCVLSTSLNTMASAVLLIGSHRLRLPILWRSLQGDLLEASVIVVELGL